MELVLAMAGMMLPAIYFILYWVRRGILKVCIRRFEAAATKAIMTSSSGVRQRKYLFRMPFRECCHCPISSPVPSQPP